jgi:hypothetical protein
LLQKEFWEKTKWLSFGSLIALRQSAQEMSFVEIIDRDANELAKMDTCACVKIRFCHAKDERDFLATLAAIPTVCGPDGHTWLMQTSQQPKDGTGGPVLAPPHVTFADAVQISNNFHVCRSILEALQSSRLAAPPFASTLFGGDHSRPFQPLSKPNWQLNTDASTREWLEAQIIKMDAAQQAAFHEALSCPVALIQGPPGAACATSLVL